MNNDLYNEIINYLDLKFIFRCRYISKYFKNFVDNDFRLEHFIIYRENKTFEQKYHINKNILIKHCKSLKVIDIVIRNLVNIKTIENIDDVEDEPLENLYAQAPDFTRIQIKYQQIYQPTYQDDGIDDDLLLNFQNGNLETLYLTGNNSIKGHGIKVLSKLKVLVFLYNSKFSPAPNLFPESIKTIAVGNSLSDNDIANLHKLEELFLLNDQTITNNGLKNLKNLKRLHLANNNIITDEGLRNLSKLEKLILSTNNNITDKGLEFVKNISELIMPSNTLITIKGIQLLQNLNKLDLSKNPNVTNDVLKNLKNLKKVKKFGEFEWSDI